MLFRSRDEINCRDHRVRKGVDVIVTDVDKERFNLMKPILVMKPSYGLRVTGLFCCRWRAVHFLLTFLDYYLSPFHSFGVL